MKVVVSPTPTRVHVLDPRDWAHAAGTDFWLVAGNVDLIAAGSDDLTGYGWVSDGYSFQAASGADFGSSADKGTTGGFNFDTAEDTLLSPAIFGDWAHLKMVEAVLGYTPTKLCAEFVMRLAANNDEEGTGIGFWEDTATDPVTKATAQAVVTSDGTNFSLESGAAADAGSTDNTAAHLFKIVGTIGSTWEWFIDGTSQGTLAIQTDVFPLKFGGGTFAAGANDPVLTWAHIWYE